MTSAEKAMTRLLTMKEAASKAGVSVTTLWRMRKDTPTLNTVRLIKRELVEEDVFLDWLRSRTSATADNKKTSATRIR